MGARRASPKAARRARSTELSSCGSEHSSSATSAAAHATGPPAKVEPWSPGWKTSARRGPVTSAPIGRPPPSAFAVVIASGTTPVCSIGPEGPGPAHAGLDLVEDERRAGAVASLARRPQQLGGQWQHAALPLNRLEQYRGRLRTDRRPERIGVLGDDDESGHQRRERRLLRLLRGRRQRAVRAAVEGIVQDDDLRRLGGRAGRASAPPRWPRPRSCRRTPCRPASCRTAPWRDASRARCSTGSIRGSGGRPAAGSPRRRADDSGRR